MYWTVLSNCAMWSRMARTRSRGADFGAKQGLVHAGGMGQLGVVVVAEDVVEGPRRGPVRVDVRMRVDQRDMADFRVQVLGETIVEHGEQPGQGLPVVRIALVYHNPHVEARLLARAEQVDLTSRQRSARRVRPLNNSVAWSLRQALRENTMSGRISLCMIARNEEANLPGCLQPMKGLVDEIVLVDTGSSDRTKEVATVLGAQFSIFRGSMISRRRVM